MRCVICERIRDSVVEGAIDYLRDALDLDETALEEVRTVVATSIDAYCDELAEGDHDHVGEG